MFILLQNLTHENGTDALVRIWGILPDSIVQQLADSGVTTVSGRNFFGFASHCWGRDVIFVGGQLIRDNASILGLMGLAAAGTISRISGGRVISRGLGISKLRSPTRIWLWRYLLLLFAYVQVRDATSLRKLDRLLLRKTGRLTADVAFAQTPWTDKFTEHPRPTRELIVIAPCEASSENRAIASWQIARVVAALPMQDGPRQIAIVCHDIRPGADDVIATTIRDDLIELAPDIIQPASIQEMIDLYREARFVITNRLHSAIFGYLSGATVLIIDDQNAKLIDFAQYAEVDQIFSGTSQTDIMQAISHAEAAGERRVAILASLSARSAAQFAHDGAPLWATALPQKLPLLIAGPVTRGAPVGCAVAAE